jgi:serine/threonine protein kinase
VSISRPLPTVAAPSVLSTDAAGRLHEQGFEPAADSDTASAELVEDQPTAELVPPQHQIAATGLTSNDAGCPDTNVGPPDFDRGGDCSVAVDDDITEPRAVTSVLQADPASAGAPDRAKADWVDNHSPPRLVHDAGAGKGDPPARELAVGTVLRSRYVLEQIIGRGGDAIVFRAQDLHRAAPEQHSAGGPIAMKVLLPEQRLNPRALTRLKREFRQMQCLTHPGIARVFDLDCDGDIWFMSMELVAGQTVNARLQEPLGLREGVKLIGDCCEALEHAHSLGILHGDLKPSNVLVAPDGSVKLIDFGSAPSCGVRIDAGSDLSLAATASYASPQVLAGSIAQERDDVFSLACLSYVILSRGKRPFDRQSSLDAGRARLSPAYVPNIPARLFEVVARGLAPEREQRQSSVREFLNELMGADLSRSAVPASADTPSLLTDSSDLLATRASNSVSPSASSDSFGVMLRAEPHLVRSREVVFVALSAMGSRLWGSALSYWRAQTRVILIGLLVLMLVLIMGAVVLVRQAVQPNVTPTRESPRSVPAKVPDPVATATPAVAVPPRAVPAAEPRVIPAVTPEPRASGRVTFDSPAVSVATGQSLVAIQMKRLESTGDAGSVAWTIESGTAQPDVDYEPVVPQVVRFIEGQAVRSLFIPLVKRSPTAGSRGPRTFSVALRKVTGGPALGPVTRITVTILPPPSADDSVTDGPDH